MKNHLLSVLIILVGSLFVSNAARAIDGRNAVGMCIDSNDNGNVCAWSVNDKGEVDICTHSGCVYCPSATEECTPARERPRPMHGLAGTIVATQFGWFEVGKNPGIDKLIPDPKKP